MESLEPFYQRCKVYSDSIVALKNEWRSTRNLQSSPHFIGKLGECLVAEKLGLLVNFDVSYNGDGGKDLELNGWRLDVKSTAYWKAPELKEFPNPKNPPDVYILTAINANKMVGKICGFISSKKLLKTPVIEYRGLGLRHAIKASELCTNWELLQQVTKATKPF
jgi:hypothetical protein